MPKKEEEVISNKDKLILNPEETKQKKKDSVFVKQWRDNRDRTHEEFDDMDYVTRYQTNRKADLSHMPPAADENDVRVAMGTLRERDNALISALLNYNFEPELVAYNDKGIQEREIASAYTDIVRNSRERNGWDRVRGIAYRELIVQGNIDVLLRHYRKPIPNYEVEGTWDPKKDPVHIKVKKREGRVQYEEGCEYIPIQGLLVYWPNMKQPDKSKQYQVAIIEDITREAAEAEFGEWFRWKFVPKTPDNADTQDPIYAEWHSYKLEKGWVRKMWIFDEQRGTFQMYLNWTPMYPVNMPLKEISPSGKIPLASGSCEEIPFFAYAKGYADKTKVEAAVLDEIVRLAILMQRKENEPPMLNASQETLTRDMFLPASVTDVNDTEIDKKIIPLMKNLGTNAGNLKFAEFMKEVIASKTVADWLTADTGADRKTATEVLEMKKQALRKLGLVVWGVVRFEKQMGWLQLWHDLKYTTQPNEDGEFKQLEVDGTLDDGSLGRKEYVFDDKKANRPMTKENMIRHEIEEDLATEANRINTRIIYLSPTDIKRIKLLWTITSVPTEEETSELEHELFVRKVANAGALFGPGAVNIDYAKRRFLVGTNEKQEFFNAPQEQAEAEQQIDPGAVEQIAKPAADELNLG